ncbi:hypothetical protein VPNG_00792 [Cytospora leucostoma]|uniref:AMP-dependent synthetase/ligase domain-containing protein n=1 Tax=Cytospora leucostoma TaxID=1230097 RepID=A0A423XMC1_9PEZI|nr:hypothetical protein VPNG_00792 [Cytospora leucostoma]
MASVAHRGPDGSVIYKAAYQLEIPNLDILTLLFDSKWCDCREETLLHADATDPENKHLTKAHVRHLTTQLAHALRHTHSIGQDGPNKDVVLVMTMGHYMLQPLFLGTIAAGAMYSAASPGSTSGELAYLVGLVGPKVIVCDTHTRAVVEETVHRVGFPSDRVFVLGDDPGLDLREPTSGRRLELSPSRTLSWARITDPEELENNIACILFSSGTTGLPKGVKLSHRMLLAEAFLVIEPDKVWAAREMPGLVYRTLAHLPAAHIAGLQGYLINPMYRGGTVYWMPRFDFVRFLDHCRAFQITTFFSVPPIYLAIAKHSGISDHFDSVYHAVGGAAPLSARIQADAERKMGKGKARLTQVWGLTETTGAITQMPPGKSEYTGSVGMLVANHEARIVDDDGKDVEPGATGEIWVRGPVVTKGYWENDSANAESFVDGWFCTGDIAFFKGGMFYIVDRKKEFIKYKGTQVAPAELEALLLSHPMITDAAVVGVEKDGDEVPRAYVVPNTKVTTKQIINWADGKVAGHKKLRGGVVFVEAIPKSPAGKILRKVLRDQAKAEEKTAKL